MKFNRVLLFTLLGVFTVLLSACGTPPATNWPGMSTDGATIYLADGLHVYNVKASDGKEVTANISGTISPLRFPVESDSNMSFYSIPAVSADGILFVGNAAANNHAFYAVNAADGQVKWTYDKAIRPWLAGSLVLEDKIFAPAGDGSLYVFTASGEIAWQKKLSDHALWTAPVTDGTSVYVATLEHEVYSFNPASDQENWKVELDNGIIGHPSLVDGILYVGTLSGNLYALDASNGAQVWVQKLEGNIWGTPAIDGGTIYIGTVFGTAGKFYAINAENGQVVWSRDEEGSIVAGPLALAEQVIYVTETGRIQSVDKTGAPMWQDDLPKNKIYTPPLLVGDLIVVAPMGSEFLLAAYDQNGAQKWTFIPTK